MTKRFEYLHQVGFEETNLVGNVYFANYIKWQGICRERFLEKNATQLLKDIDNGLALITLNCGCEYLGELRAFDKVMLCMYLEEIRQNRVKMRFDYVKTEGGKEVVIAKGSHEIACYVREDDGMRAVPVPEYIATALMPYQSTANQY